MYLIALLLTLRLVADAKAPLDMEPQALVHAIRNFLQQESTHRQTHCVTAAFLGSDGQYARFRLSLYGSDVTRIIAGLHALTAHSPLLLCQRRYEVESIDLTHPVWSRVSTWADILAASAARMIRFSFATPLITRRPTNPVSWGALPFPEPIPLFSSVIDPWQELGGPELPDDPTQLVQATDCVISHYRLFTRPVVIGGHSISGYLGWIEYECRRPDHPYLASLNALARLAFFTGTGYNTAQGLGATAVSLRS